MQTLSLRTLFRTLSLTLLVVVGLSVVGCDSGGSNGGGSNGNGSGDSPAWVGNWKQMNDGQAVFALSLSQEQVKTTERATCTTRTMEVTNISDDNVITAEANGNTRKQKVAVQDDGTLEVTFQSDGRTETYQSADDSKTTEAIVGCN